VASSEFMLEILSDESLRGWTDEERDCGGWGPLPFFRKRGF
jgi:hypothetical protein